MCSLFIYVFSFHTIYVFSFLFWLGLICTQVLLVVIKLNLEYSRLFLGHDSLELGHGSFE